MTRHLIETAVVAAAAVVVSYGVGFVLTHRAGDEYARHYVRRAVHFIVFLVALVALGFVWHVYGGRAGIGTAADRPAGVHGSLGARAAADRPARGRLERGDLRRPRLQLLGDVGVRLAGADVPDRPRRGRAPGGAIIAEEAQRVSATEEAHEAMEEMRRRYPVPKSELEPRVYATATDNYMELAARFVVPVRQARPTTTELTRRVTARLDEVGIPISSSTTDVTLFSGDDRTSRGSSRSG